MGNRKSDEPLTPGQNEKYYLTGALHNRTGKLVMWAEAESEVQGHLPAGLLAMGKSC